MSGYRLGKELAKLADPFDFLVGQGGVDPPYCSEE
jgi:hypothetical protein